MISKFIVGENFRTYKNRPLNPMLQRGIPPVVRVLLNRKKKTEHP
jgi:hypothetical protein